MSLHSAIVHAKVVSSSLYTSSEHNKPVTHIPHAYIHILYYTCTPDYCPFAFTLPLEVHVL